LREKNYREIRATGLASMSVKRSFRPY
jgi:hypothetical protein